MLVLSLTLRKILWTVSFQLVKIPIGATEIAQIRCWFIGRNKKMLHFNS